MKKMLSLLFCILLMMSAALAVAEEAKPLAGKKLTIALSPNFMFFETVSETRNAAMKDWTSTSSRNSRICWDSILKSSR